MITEIAIVWGTFKIVDSIANREALKVKNTWKKVLGYQKVQSAPNVRGNCLIENPYKLKYMIETGYGYDLKVNIPLGKSLEDLEKLERIISRAYKSLVEIKCEDTDIFATVKIIDKPMKNLIYEPIKTTPTQVYVGYDYSHHILIDMMEFPHILLSGVTNSGKTKMLECMLTTMIVNHGADVIEIYLMDIGKGDLFAFDLCTQVRCIADDLISTFKMLRYIQREFERRKKIINDLNKKKIRIRNGNQYNLMFPDKKFRILFFIADEAMFYMATDQDKYTFPDSKLTYINGKNEEKPLSTADIKHKCYDMFNTLLTLARAYCMYGCLTMQRPDRNSLNPELKINLNTVIAYKAMNEISSKVAIDDSTAAELKMREAIVRVDERYYVEAPELSSETVAEYIKPSEDPNHKLYKFDYDGNIIEPEPYHKNTVNSNIVDGVEYTVDGKKEDPTRGHMENVTIEEIEIKNTTEDMSQNSTQEHIMQEGIHYFRTKI